MRELYSILLWFEGEEKEEEKKGEEKEEEKKEEKKEEEKKVGVSCVEAILRNKLTSTLTVNMKKRRGGGEILKKGKK